MENKILIYDDDVEILLLCKAILSKYKYTTETLMRCDDILNDIESLKPDLILMDLWIPEMGGEKAIAIAKQNEQTRHIPILVFSANADIADISVKLQADGFVEKPFTINHLIQTIQKHLF
ncbi:MAG: response regulator [Chitinophagaceae bacterium]